MVSECATDRRAVDVRAAILPYLLFLLLTPPTSKWGCEVSFDVESRNTKHPAKHHARDVKPHVSLVRIHTFLNTSHEQIRRHIIVDVHVGGGEIRYF